MDESVRSECSRISDEELFNLSFERYKHYFDVLDQLGEFGKWKNDNVKKPPKVELSKVGAKPLSGIRGIYFSKGCWKVKYIDDYGEIVPCILQYDSDETLIASFDVSHLLLRKVIEYGRQINTEDGTIIDEPTKEKLIALDNRNKRGYSPLSCNVADGFKGLRSRLREVHPVVPYGTIAQDDEDDDEDYEEEVLKRRKGNAKSKKRGRPRVVSEKSDRRIINDFSQEMKGYRMSAFEKKLTDYADLSTMGLLDHVIDHGSLTQSKIPYMIESSYGLYTFPSTSAYGYTLNPSTWNKIYPMTPMDSYTMGGISYGSSIYDPDHHSMDQLQQPQHTPIYSQIESQMKTDQQIQEEAEMEQRKQLELVKMYKFDHCFGKHDNESQ
ncbi:hypothetical protein BdWA1_001882 [Babesia duncani]|uniref:Uncharacterized protein n=1 Tax=Babesia duncani TaxID=323732 RepID=A0AAD9PKQ9_9APIC|nr:hypothetical protein BdWA1_001882 [Babesia duncani]